jgi:sortase A
MRVAAPIIIGAFLLWNGVLRLDGVVTYDFALRPGEIVPAAAAAEPRVGIPARITIPSISVDASIEEVALTENGAMDVPKLPHDAAWYGLGPRPGEIGSAAITGHVDDENGAAAVFADLHKVKAGDRILVRDDAGAVTPFIVRESRRYDADEEAREVFASDDGGSHLSVITCDGPWDKRAGQYAKRLVVFADQAQD